MLPLSLPKTLRAFPSDQRGNVIITSALVLPALLGFASLGAEAASWYTSKRALQNAADSAAIAAATNATEDGYDDEARAVAAQYGLRHGEDTVTVEAANHVTCPNGEDTCYRVTITKTVPLLLAQVVGYKGDGGEGGAGLKRISAVATAIQGLGPREYCLVALANSRPETALRTNGAPDADLTGCSVMSNTGATCNGHDLRAEYGDAVGTNNGCGKRSNSGVEPIEDQYAHLAENIPEHDCSAEGYWYASTSTGGTPPPARDRNRIQNLEGPGMNPHWGSDGVRHICGDAWLNAPALVNAPEGGVLVIHDGNLYMNRNRLETLPDSNLTIIFTGKDTSRGHAPVGRGELDFAAPTTGPWKGIAMYQDPKLKKGTDIQAAGNSPTWNITGLVYAPYATVTFSGVVNKATNGHSCFAMVVDQLVFNGTTRILSQGQCREAGLDMPYSRVPTRGQLVS